MKTKTLQECKDEVARKIVSGYYNENGKTIPTHYENWEDFNGTSMSSIRAGISPTRLFSALDEAAELYAQQFRREWISVEKSPTSGKEYYVLTYELGTHFYHVAEFNNGEWSTHSEILYCVTHYMEKLPLPTKP